MLLAELKVFLAHPRNMRVLLLTNFVFALVLPVIDLFVTAYVMRNSHDVRLVMSYQMALYTGIPLAFFANGWLLRLLPIRHLYSFGMLLAPLSMAVLMTLSRIEIGGIAATGLMMGFAMGIYWANRDVLALVATHDGSRNYYYALETFFGTLCGLVVPVSVGWFIAGTEAYGWLGGDRNRAYHFLTAGAFVLACVASAMICRGRFEKPAAISFIHWRFDALWRRVRWMSVFRGIGQGFGTTAPMMLVMRLMGGQEGVLGAMQTGGMIVMAVGIYLVGRIARPEHRLGLLFVGLALSVAGAVANAVFYNAVGVILYFLLLLLGRPLIENTVTPVQNRAIDLLSEREKRSNFAYLFNNEFALYVGRLAGGLLFIGAATLSEELALRYVLLAIAVLQVAMFFFCRAVQRRCKRIEPHPASENEPAPSPMLG